ncbi:MAG: hypothetical protein K0S84_1570 [Nitrososphaera sp.]|nr:hypothetical protein [Nitrososphaera sp.]
MLKMKFSFCSVVMEFDLRAIGHIDMGKKYSSKHIAIIMNLIYEVRLVNSL